MDGNRITGLGTPSANADATTKKYVDDLVVFTSDNGQVPSWAALAAQSWDTPHHGSSWSVDNGNNKLQGVGACLSTSSKSGGVPAATSYGLYCWCRVESINDVRVLGAWVYTYKFLNIAECYSRCATNCGYCVSLGTLELCTRAALFAAP